MSFQYRSKPVVIEAWQHFDDCGTHTIAIPKWIIDAVADGTIYVEDKTTKIKTLEGNMIARDSDYIIRGIKGELYPCKPDIFEAKYEKV